MQAAVSGYVSQVMKFGSRRGCRRVATARAARRAFGRCVRCGFTGSFLGGGARVRGAACGSADCRPRGVVAPAMASHAVAATRGWPALARWPVLAQCPIQAPNAGSTASSVPWSAREAKVPGRDPCGAAIRGQGCVRLTTARAGALRRARPPRRREGLFVCLLDNSHGGLRRRFGFWGDAF